MKWKITKKWEKKTPKKHQSKTKHQNLKNLKISE